MNWDAIGAVGEILGALAVTLVYLAKQLRENTTSNRISSFWAMMQSFKRDPAFCKAFSLKRSTAGTRTDTKARGRQPKL
jgi:hypothetical protein